MTEIQVETVSFFSNESVIKGHLYIPGEKKEQYPAIILCHGFAGVKEIILPQYAEFFAEKGYLCLTFDYRGFGESEGLRGYIRPQWQIEDIRNAITYMSKHLLVNQDQIGLWGTSFGGANVVSAATQDNRVGAVVSQMPFANGERVIKGDLSDDEKQKLDQTISKAWAREVSHNKVLKLAADQILSDPDSKQFFQDLMVKNPDIAVRIPLTSLKYILEYKPENEVGNLKTPTCFIAAEKDTVCPKEEAESLYNKSSGEKDYCLIDQVKHYDIYEGDAFKRSCQRALYWFNKHLQKKDQINAAA